MVLTLVFHPLPIFTIDFPLFYQHGLSNIVVSISWIVLSWIFRSSLITLFLIWSLKFTSFIVLNVFYFCCPYHVLRFCCVRSKFHCIDKCRSYDCFVYADFTIPYKVPQVARDYCRFFSWARTSYIKFLEFVIFTPKHTLLDRVDIYS